ncbi:hypothetical protein HNO52_14620 [Billgrantia diversa]|uniref:polysaccharide lyase n=1 Tax=Halomonas sp. MCCC 1A13316 TaxID=2733487 RepID=UPI0018A40E5A|nr:hypothetical protein [Halomonas sp. MCCC 1A13316]QOR39612.1 hypothetical protein HNO52_14620 [Halomonas sp. MCCC 1A13316]
MTADSSRRALCRCSGIALIALASLGASPLFADLAEDANVGIPQVSACSQRYTAAEAPQPASGVRAHEAIREGFNTTQHWGTKENVERLGAGFTGLGTPGLRVHYPAGTSSPGEEPRGGAGFYSDPPSLRGAERACLSYKIRFPSDFDFVKGGKLPGLYGGDAPSGGEEVDGNNGFSMRLMWREGGKGELYPYVVGFEGDSVGRGAWSFPVGQWVTVEQELILNDPGHENGVARLWIDGRPVLEQQNVTYRTTPELTIDGLMFSTFFGGTGGEWRTPRDQYVDFADFRFYAQP